MVLVLGLEILLSTHHIPGLRMFKAWFHASVQVLGSNKLTSGRCFRFIAVEMVGWGINEQRLGLFLNLVDGCDLNSGAASTLQHSLSCSAVAAVTTSRFFANQGWKCCLVASRPTKLRGHGAGEKG